MVNTQQVITWDPSYFGSPGQQVKLKLFQGCRFHSWISGPTDNDGNFLWRVPCDLEAGDDYQIQIYSVSDFSLMDFSDADFTILQPTCLVWPEWGVEWVAGSQETILWEPDCFGSSEERVKLKLFKNCRFHSWISGPTPNDGEFLWRVPCETEPGSSYRIQIYAESDFSLMDFSDGDLAIVSPACLATPNGGEEWMVNTQQVITWDPVYFGSPAQQVKLKLFKGCRFHSWISGPTNNDGTFWWRVPCDLEAGDDYRIQIYSASDFSFQDFSDGDFTVLQPTCLTVPDGGEQWVIGSRPRISWNPVCFGDQDDFVKLKLFQGCGFYGWISGSTPNDGTFDWTVPGNVAPSWDYRVQIYSVSDFSIMDFSDGDFGILAGK
ncbi:MAG: hypothetical protein GWP08_15160, partial [Nitrospiraceae bacterium]|nr:hypothetical protein [Nitrospiraceae bacterium]